MESEEMVLIPRRVITMLHIEGYFSEFWRLVQEGHTHAEAYLLAERQLEEYGLPQRYESYETFKVMKSRHHKGEDPNILFW